MPEINIVLSGGTQNTEPRKSLGGFPSPIPITTDKNNLFENISAQQTTQGKTDYRCVYVFNDDEDIRYQMTIYQEYLNDVGATIQFGFLLQNDVQRLQFPQTPTGGTFRITIQGLQTDDITWNSDPSVVATRIKTALDAFTTSDVVSTSGFNFLITFTGDLGNKALTSLTITNNNLTPLGTITPTVTKVTTGSPINTVAPDIGDEKTAPNGITFQTVLTPGVTIGTIFPAEGFPLWVKRSITQGFEEVEDDGFKLQMDIVGKIT